MLHTSAMPCLFVKMVKECNFYISLSFLTSKNVSGTLFVVWLLVNTLVCLFCDILICKYASRMYLVAV